MYPNSGVIPSMLGLYPRSVHYPQFLRHTFGCVNSWPTAKHCVYYVRSNTLFHLLDYLQQCMYNTRIPFKIRVYSCLPEDVPMTFETCRTRQKLKNPIKVLIWKGRISLVYVAQLYHNARCKKHFINCVYSNSRKNGSHFVPQTMVKLQNILLLF
jgi:hypothetical protein